MGQCLLGEGSWEARGPLRSAPISPRSVEMIPECSLLMREAEAGTNKSSNSRRTAVMLREQRAEDAEAPLRPAGPTTVSNEDGQ